MTERYDNGKWNFYLDSDGNKGLPENDVKFGEVWIKHGNYFLEEDKFSVQEGNSKERKVELKYQAMRRARARSKVLRCIF